MSSKLITAALIGGAFLSGALVQRAFTQGEQAWVMRIDYLKSEPGKLDAAISNERDRMQRVHQELVNGGHLRYWGAFRVVPNTYSPKTPSSTDYDLVTVQVAKNQDAFKTLPWTATFRKLFPEQQPIGSRKLVRMDMLELIAETSGRP